MKYSVFLSGRAESDLTNQYQWYLENATVTIAERFINAFDRTTELLRDFPEVGRTRRFRARQLHGVRSISFGGKFADHIIFYGVTGHSINIVRVMHGARDLDRRLLEPPEN